MSAARRDDLGLRASPDVHPRTQGEILHCVTLPRHAGAPLRLVDLLQFGVLTEIVTGEVGMIYHGLDLSIGVAGA
jgi:hypothetical protein